MKILNENEIRSSTKNYFNKFDKKLVNDLGFIVSRESAMQFALDNILEGYIINQDQFDQEGLTAFLDNWTAQFHSTTDL